MKRFWGTCGWALLLAGCRGCGQSPFPSEKAAQQDPLLGTDCSDGLARCIQGQIEISRAAHLPFPCTSRETRGCTCPWERVASCERRGCAAEGLEVLAAKEVVTSGRLCRPDGAVARPLLPTDEPSPNCSDEGIGCVAGRVGWCAARGVSPQILGVCLHGCETQIGVPSIDAESSSDRAGVVAILCRSHHAERQ